MLIVELHQGSSLIHLQLVNQLFKELEGNLKFKAIITDHFMVLLVKKQHPDIRECHMLRNVS